MKLDDALELAWQMFDRYGLTQSGWTLDVTNHRRYLGICCGDARLIVLSRYHIEQHGRADVLDTILHEIAHALVGPDHDHDEVWRAKARELGAEPLATATNCCVRRTRTIHL